MTARTRGSRSRGSSTKRRTQSPPLRRALVVEALRSWVVPAVTLTLVALFWLLSAAGMVSGATAVTGVAGALLVLAIFASLGRYLFSGSAAERWPALAFAIAWGAILFLAVCHRDFPGRPLALGRLHPGEAALAVPPARHYAIVVDGRFRPAAGTGARSGTYRLEVVPSGGEPLPLVGSFRDSWVRQRLGRRGSAQVEIRRTSALHHVDPPEGRAVTLRLATLDPSLEPELAVEVYPDLPGWLLPLAGIAGLAFVLAWEKGRRGDGTVLTAFSLTYGVVLAYLHWGSPHPELRSLVGAVLVGAIAGAPFAMIVWRVVPARWFAPAAG